MNEKIQQLQQIIDQATHIVFFTGAGVSTESGIPDFRSQDGLYHQKYDLPPEEIISHSYFVNHPEEFFRFYKDRMIYPDAKPNHVHTFIAECERKHKSLGVVTQNIDGLHQKAGSKRVCELHGSVLRNYCTRCGKSFSGEFIAHSQGIPRCSCGGIVKPDVVLYEESLDSRVIEDSVQAIAQADLLMVLGTSLTVYPAAGLIRYYRGHRLVLINRDATPYDDRADLVFHESLGTVFSQL